MIHESLGRIFEPRANYAPWDNFWYEPYSGGATASGVSVSPERALQISAVYAAVGILAETLSHVPLKVHRRLDPRGKEVATQHPLYRVLHDRANDIQTSMEWREMSMAHLALRGNAYSEIVAGPRSPIDQLWPLNPDRMRPMMLSNRRIGYSYTDEKGRQISYTQDEIFHVRGRSLDGFTGLNPIAYMRESNGLTLALEQFGALLFKQGALHRGVFKHPGKLSELAHNRLKKDLAEDSGLSNAHGTKILEEGMSWEKISMTSDDAQFLLSRKFQLSEIARWFHVPPHLLGDLEKATFSNIEQQSLEFVLFTMMPWFVRWEQRINADLIFSPQTYFAEFTVDGLLRGDAASRWAAHKVAIETGTFTRNEVREMENRNPLNGLDRPLVPQNFAEIDESGNARPINKPADLGPPAPANAMDSAIEAEKHSGQLDPELLEQLEQARRVVNACAERVIRKEGLAIGKALARYADEPAKLQKWAEQFYSDQAKFVSDVLRVAPEKGQKFATHQKERLFLSLKDNCAGQLIKELESTDPAYVLEFLKNGHNGDRAAA